MYERLRPVFLFLLIPHRVAADDASAERPSKCFYLR